MKIERETGDILLSLEPSSSPSSTSSKADEEQKQSQRQQHAAESAVTTTQETKVDEKIKKAKNEFELTLLDKQEHSGTDIMSFRFSKQDNLDKNTSLDYIPGQYAFFDIGGVNNDPKGPIRHFSIASSPTEDFIMISTRIRDTPYKKRLSSLETGDGTTKVKVRGPQGKFVLHQEDYSKPAVLLSGGIGVTPFRSMIKYATDKKLPLKIVMFDSNRDVANILYKEEFDEWLKTNKNLKIVYTITEEEGGGGEVGQQQEPSQHESWKGERGRINEIMLRKHLTSDELINSVFYTCGPPGMIKAMQTLLQENLQIPKEQIKVEEFTGY